MLVEVVQRLELHSNLILETSLDSRHLVNPPRIESLSRITKGTPKPISILNTMVLEIRLTTVISMMITLVP